MRTKDVCFVTRADRERLPGNKRNRIAEATFQFNSLLGVRESWTPRRPCLPLERYTNLSAWPMLWGPFLQQLGPTSRAPHLSTQQVFATTPL